MDVHIPLPITPGWRRLGVNVLTAQEDGSARLPDPTLLDRAGELGCLVFTMDTDFIAEAIKRMRGGERFATVIYISQTKAVIAQCIDDLALLAEST